METSKHTQEEDMQLLLQILVQQPDALSALRRMDRRMGQLALALLARHQIDTVKMSDTQRTAVSQVQKVSEQPALVLARSLVDRITVSEMQARGLNPKSKTDYLKFTKELGGSILIKR